MKHGKSLLCLLLALLLLTGCAPAAQSPAPAETQQTAEPQAAAAEEPAAPEQSAEQQPEQAEAEFAGQGYGVFKPAVGEAVVELMRPIREETEKLLGDKAYLESIYKEGAEKAAYLANKTLRKVYKKVGFVAR